MLPVLLRELRAAKGVIVGTHLHPDGDAVGAALAMSHVLDQLEVEHEVLCNDPPPYYLKFLPGSERFKQQPKGEAASLGVLLDLEARSRLGSVAKFFEKCPRTVVIDHHVPAESPGDLRIVHVHSPATCSILLDLFVDSEIEVTPQIADCLLTGILTDTGNFRYPNTDAHSLHAAGYLLEKGANLARITEEVYMRKELPAVVLSARAVLRMKTACDGRLAWTTLPHELFKEVGANEQHSEGIANELLTLKGVQVAVVLRESRPGRIKGSLRSLGPFDVASVAHSFGGGGHVNAAGISFNGGLEEAEDALVAALKECLASS